MNMFEIIGNGGNNMNHFYPIGTIVERLERDTDDTCLYVDQDGMEQWVGDDDVKEVV